MSQPTAKPSGLIKPTLMTRYHIDYSWWERSGDDLRTYLLSHLPVEQREKLSAVPDNALIEYIDPETGEVFELDQLRLALQTAAKEPGFINPQSSVVDSIFRVFLSNGNVPLNSDELSAQIKRPPR